MPPQLALKRIEVLLTHLRQQAGSHHREIRQLEALKTEIRRDERVRAGARRQLEILESLYLPPDSKQSHRWHFPPFW